MGTSKFSVSTSWISFFQASLVDSSRAKIVIRQATDRFPNDASLWNKRLSLSIDESSDPKTIKREFSRACQNSDVKVNPPHMLNFSGKKEFLLEFVFDLDNGS